MNSIKAHPEILRNGTECLQLKYVGPKIGKLIDLKLAKYQQTHPTVLEDLDISINFNATLDSSIPRVATAITTSTNSSTVPKLKKTTREKKYVPSHRSGAYAILLALHLHSNSTQYMSKEEIMTHGQQYCNHSFRMFDPSHRLYTPWSSMKTLTEKELVSATTSRPLRYALTDEGVELASLLARSLNTGAETSNTAITITASSSIITSTITRAKTTTTRARPRAVAPAAEPMVASILTPIATNVPKQVSLASTFYEGKRKVQIKKEQEALENYSGQLQRIPFGCYDILLVLDNREVRKRGDRDFFQLELEKLGVPVLTKQMELGDICWVARSKTNVNELYMLDYIVERKKNDDLASSIKDGRFKEQKHRLNKCGVSNLIYLVEEYDPTLFSSAAMTTAITETIVGNDFFVKMTTNAMDTVQYLAKFTKLLVHQYKDVDLYVLDTNDIRLETHHVLRKALSKDKPCLIPFQTFNSLNTKTKVITNRDLWQKQLLTIRGVSQEKARILSRHFPTFQSLISKLDEQRDEESKIKLFTDLKMGPALAKKIVNVFC